MIEFRPQRPITCNYVHLTPTPTSLELSETHFSNGPNCIFHHIYATVTRFSPARRPLSRSRDSNLHLISPFVRPPFSFRRGGQCNFGWPLGCRLREVDTRTDGRHEKMGYRAPEQGPKMDRYGKAGHSNVAIEPRRMSDNENPASMHPYTTSTDIMYALLVSSPSPMRIVVRSCCSLDITPGVFAINPSGAVELRLADGFVAARSCQWN